MKNKNYLSPHWKPVSLALFSHPVSSKWLLVDQLSGIDFKSIFYKCETILEDPKIWITSEVPLSFYCIVLSSYVLSNDKGNYEIVSSEIPLSLLLYRLVMCQVLSRGTTKLFQVNYPSVCNFLVICVE